MTTVRSRCFEAALVLAAVLAPLGVEAREAALKSEVYAADAINPNRRGTPQPVKLHIFYLAEDDAFVQANFADLVDPESSVLGKELIRRTERLVGPGEMLQLSETLDEAAQFIGVVAAFTDIERANWRAVMALPVRKWSDIVRLLRSNKLEIRIDGTAVTCAIVKD